MAADQLIEDPTLGNDGFAAGGDAIVDLLGCRGCEGCSGALKGLAGVSDANAFML